MATLAPVSPMIDADLADKARFAEAYLKHNDAIKAAQEVSPVNVGRSLRIANEWMGDPFVQAEIRRLVEDKGEGAFLQSKADILKSIKRRADLCSDHNSKDYVLLMELYCKVAGFVEKPGANAVQVNVQSVMVVKSQGSDDEWEANARRSQNALMDANND